MLPFLVNMERLYELFVAEWLKAHLPTSLGLNVQEKIDVGENKVLTFKIDLVLYDHLTGKTICVMDTKYKRGEKPTSEDVAQIVTYAEIKNCDQAVLVYPAPLSIPLIETVGKIQVRSMIFSLAGNLEEAGQAFLESLLDIFDHDFGDIVDPG